MQNDLISRSALLAYVKEIPTYEPTDRGFLFKRYPSGLFAPSDIVKSIENAPAVDAVEVVRCKDCVYSFRNNGHEKEGCPIKDANIWLGENGFCSLGERRG